MTFFIIFLSIIIIQRISELILSKRNENYLRSRGAVEYDKKGYKYIVLMHNLFFISVITEFVFLERQLNEYWKVLLIIFICTQLLRYWALFSLGKRWNTKILVLPNTEPIRSGLYKHLKHPNYIAVIIEIGVIPLLFSCYYTAVVFSILNLIVLKRRIRIEEKVLNI